MALLLALLLPGPSDLADKLRPLNSVAAAWAPTPSRDVSRVAFLTTLFGTCQAASMAAEGGYPLQLTDEPGGVLAIRFVPADSSQLIALAIRGGRHRILLLADAGAPEAATDPAPGDHLLRGLSPPPPPPPPLP